MSLRVFDLRHVLYAGIVEQVGWTNGSLHNQVEMQPWYVRTMTDVVLALALAVFCPVLMVGLAARWLILRLYGNHSLPAQNVPQGKKQR